MRVKVLSITNLNGETDYKNFWGEVTNCMISKHKVGKSIVFYGDSFQKYHRSKIIRSEEFEPNNIVTYSTDDLIYHFEILEE